MTLPTRPDRPAPSAPPAPAEVVHAVTVYLTAREMAAVEHAAICVTSADDDHHRVNYASSAIRRLQEAVTRRRS
ncbi:hypothetical protein ACWEFJ_28520 [Actinosynnema sp. NPDC004786]